MATARVHDAVMVSVWRRADYDDNEDDLLDNDIVNDTNGDTNDDLESELERIRESSSETSTYCRFPRSLSGRPLPCPFRVPRLRDDFGRTSTRASCPRDGVIVRLPSVMDGVLSVSRTSPRRSIARINALAEGLPPPSSPAEPQDGLTLVGDDLALKAELMLEHMQIMLMRRFAKRGGLLSAKSAARKIVAVGLKTRAEPLHPSWLPNYRPKVVESQETEGGKLQNRIVRDILHQLNHQSSMRQRVCSSRASSRAAARVLRHRVEEADARATTRLRWFDALNRWIELDRLSKGPSSTFVTDLVQRLNWHSQNKLEKKKLHDDKAGHGCICKHCLEHWATFANVHVEIRERSREDEELERLRRAEADRLRDEADKRRLARKEKSLANIERKVRRMLRHGGQQQRRLTSPSRRLANIEEDDDDDEDGKFTGWLTGSTPEDELARLRFDDIDDNDFDFELDDRMRQDQGFADKMLDIFDDDKSDGEGALSTAPSSGGAGGERIERTPATSGRQTSGRQTSVPSTGAGGASSGPLMRLRPKGARKGASRPPPPPTVKSRRSSLATNPDINVNEDVNGDEVLLPAASSPTSTTSNQSPVAKTPPLTSLYRDRKSIIFLADAVEEPRRRRMTGKASNASSAVSRPTESVEPEQSFVEEVEVEEEKPKLSRPSTWEKPKFETTSKRDEMNRLLRLRMQRQPKPATPNKKKRKGVDYWGDDDGVEAQIREPGWLDQFYYLQDKSLAAKCSLAFQEVNKHRRKVEEFPVGVLSPAKVAQALLLLNPDLTENEVKYVQHVLRIFLELEAVDTMMGVNSRLFNVLGAFSFRITALDDWTRTMVNSTELHELDYKMDYCRRFWLTCADPETRFMSVEQFRILFAAGGISRVHEESSLQTLQNYKTALAKAAAAAHEAAKLQPSSEASNAKGRPKVVSIAPQPGTTKPPPPPPPAPASIELMQLDVLDFLSYLPVFMHIHKHIVEHATDDSRNF